MVKMNLHYLGDKLCEAQHKPSQAILQTDAPTDNGGKGSRFSPTDLLGVALGTCVLTTMEILSEKDGKKISLKGTRAEVSKEMSGPPRRVAVLTLNVKFPAGIPKTERAYLEAIAHSCPVARSLHPELKVVTHFSYPD